MKKTFWKTFACSLGYLGLALACFIRWHAPNPWARVDFFAGSYLGLRFVGSLHSLVSSLPAFRSKPLRTEWWALNSDPDGPKWVMFLMALDLAVLLGYSRGPAFPALAQASLQTTGLGMYFAVTVWQVWIDSYLAKYFSQTEREPLPMNCGPYRYMRHPRYAAAILGKVAMALIFASILGWLLVGAWSALLLRKIAVEEQHLRRLFGPTYDAYARNTARVIPGLY